MEELDKILAFFAAHPYLWPLVVWPVVSGAGIKLLAAVFPTDDAGWRDLYKTKPRLAGAVELLQSFGMDPRNAVDATRAMLSGKPPAWVHEMPPPRNHDELVADMWRLEPAARDAIIAALTKHEPPNDPPEAA